jgi:hypothetical protein
MKRMILPPPTFNHNDKQLPEKHILTFRYFILIFRQGLG